MAEAFAILGYDSPYHFSSIFANIQDADMWLEALDMKYKQGRKVGRDFFDKLLGHTSAVTDAPCFVFWKELADAYPEAKIVLVERDEDKWYKSCDGLVGGSFNPLIMYVLQYTDRWFLGRIMRVGYAWYEGWFGTVKSRADVMSNARKSYRAHYAAIREIIPKERLLEFRLEEGWGPLCAFLGKEVPNVPFPRRNEAAALELAFEAMSKRALKNSLFNLGSVAVAIAAAAGTIKYFLRK